MPSPTDADNAMWLRLLPLTLAEWRHHPWRHAVALLAVALGVALAASVQVINHSALGEFAQAVRAVNGQPDVMLAAAGPTASTGLDDALLDRLLADERVLSASPVLELSTQARRLVPAATSADAPAAPSAASSAAPAAAPSGPLSAAPPAAAATPADDQPGGQPIEQPVSRASVRVIGIDALQVTSVAPALLPRVASGAALTAALDPGLAWLNGAARSRLALRDGDAIELQTPTGWLRLRVGGAVAAGGSALVVLDVAAAQHHFGRAGRLSRIDVRLHSGITPPAWLANWDLPGDVRVAGADDAEARLSNLSRAYRVNLSVLALVALLVGGFLVYSVLSLSVVQRTPALALLGVLGLPADQRQRWILAESAALGLLGSAVGLGLGAALAATALQWLGGDLGGGYFPGPAPALAWPWPALVACAVLGVAAAVAGAWWPARQAARLAPAQALKGWGGGAAPAPPRWPAALMLAGAAGLAMLPAVDGLPLAAYASVALLLAGGVSLVPSVVQALLCKMPGLRWTSPPLLAWLAWRRARYARQTASAAMSGVVASLALSVALTVMVTSFRHAVGGWLEQVLPADLYLRSGGDAASESSALPTNLASMAARLPGVLRVEASRRLPLVIDPRQPAVTLLARPLDQPAQQLPLLGPALPVPPGALGVFVSEPAAAIYFWAPGQTIQLPLPGGPRAVFVRGIWRDYARQFGAVAMDLGDYQRLAGDQRLNDLALWLKPGAAAHEVQQTLKALAGPDQPLDSASTVELRRLSLAIFDRSFAVTQYLQIVAIAVGLVGVAASLSAQVLARRKEFGLMAHLGFTRRQAMGLVTLETGAWLAAGCVVGVALGLAIAAVLVLVVNPQSFHWSMPMQWPGWRLAALAAAVWLAGLATAALSARRAASAAAVQAVKEDW